MSRTGIVIDAPVAPGSTEGVSCPTVTMAVVERGILLLSMTLFGFQKEGLRTQAMWRDLPVELTKKEEERWRHRPPFQWEAQEKLANRGVQQCIATLLLSPGRSKYG